MKKRIAAMSASCNHRSDAECVCGERVAVDRVELWAAINEYVISCGGDPSRYVYGNTRRMDAVSRVENAVTDRGVVTDEIGRWITEPL